MKLKEFRNAAKELGIKVLKVRNSRKGIRVTFAAIMNDYTISLAQERFYQHFDYRDFTYEDIIREWSR